MKRAFTISLISLLSHAVQLDAQSEASSQLQAQGGFDPDDIVQDVTKSVERSIAKTFEGYFDAMDRRMDAIEN